MSVLNTHRRQQTTSQSSTNRRILLSDGKSYSGSVSSMTKEMEQKFTSLYRSAIREASDRTKGIYHHSQAKSY